ncbi:MULTISPECIES: hypothetical protein [unclassified Bacillus (in: firmicutes)]|uniref:hypothetical protein n=1 Tax=Bacillaceae TaxID=186817 RepID=UPI0006AF57A7|nr:MULTISPECIES: hypothetical protein [unclassified Bacillus (in: firmicutes)]ALC86113.1 hypothetical protein AM499_09970 [Bacillus sp. FJAT-22090]MDF2068583.1 hypothetical protein [Bacillus sp. Cr_A10]
MSSSKVLKWVTGGLEAILGIPILGATIVLSFLWIPLFVMLILHIITLVITNKEGGSTTGSILGIVTSCIAWIPFVGMIMHILTAIFLMIDASKSDNKENQFV